MGYECLIAGLPEIEPGGESKINDEALLALLSETLTKADKEQLSLLQMPPDDERILTQIEAYDDTIIGQPSWWEDVREVLSEEDLRMQVLYEYGKKHGNRFVSRWFQYNQDVNNILVAVICRKHGFDVRQYIVGNNEVAQILRRKLPQKDFGLTGIADDLADVMSLAQIDNLLEREKQQDALRFRWLENQTRFIHFSIENVLAYYLQNKMLCRWSGLTVEEGEQVFRAIVSDMKKDIVLDS